MIKEKNGVEAISKNDLKIIVKESLHEVLAQEFMKFRALLLPSVSEKEQKEIEKLYDEPLRKTAKTIEVEI